MSPIQKIVHDLRRKSAQGLLEFALILPIFLLLVFGIIEAARLMMTYSSVYTSSREGARYGAAIGTVAGGAPRYRDCAGIKNAAVANGFLAGVQVANVEVRYDHGPDDLRAWDALPTCPFTPVLGDRVMVKVAVPYAPIVPLVSFPTLVVSNSDGRTIIMNFEVMGTPPPSPAPIPRTPTPTHTPPVVHVPADITVEATGPTGAIVSFTTSAIDAQGGNLTPVCSPISSGGVFPISPINDTEVTCTATDWDGLIGQATFHVIVQDTTPPVIGSSLDIGPLEATSAGGAVVTYPSPATTDIVDGAGIATCSPASGSTFAIGVTTVTCHATDSHGNAAVPTTFTVNVHDTTIPVIAAHPNIGPFPAPDATGVVVNYSPPNWTDTVDGTHPATCSPAPGSKFPVGTTAVTCNATDSHGNHATPTTFTVTVNYSASNECTTIQFVNPNIAGNEFQFEIQNSDSSTNHITAITISWVGSAQMSFATLGSSTIWTGPVSSPATSGVIVGDPSLGSGGTKHFEFNFTSSLHSGEIMHMVFSSGCYKNLP